MIADSCVIFSKINDCKSNKLNYQRWYLSGSLKYLLYLYACYDTRVQR